MIRGYQQEEFVEGDAHIVVTIDNDVVYCVVRRPGREHQKMTYKYESKLTMADYATRAYYDTDHA